VSVSLCVGVAICECGLYDKQCVHGYQNDVLTFVDVSKDWEIHCFIESSLASFQIK